MLAQGASDARTLQSKLGPEWACDCKDNEMKAYCSVGHSKAHLCCIPKGLSCRTKPSETDGLPREKRLTKNQWKMCAEDESFCNGEQLILPSPDDAKFPDGKDPVCGVEGTEAFDIAKKLACPSDLVLGPFSTVASAKRRNKDHAPIHGIQRKEVPSTRLQGCGENHQGRSWPGCRRRSQKRGRRRRTVHTKLALQQEQEEHGRIMNICEEVN